MRNRYMNDVVRTVLCNTACAYIRCFRNSSRTGYPPVVENSGKYFQRHMYHRLDVLDACSAVKLVYDPYVASNRCLTTPRTGHEDTHISKAMHMTLLMTTPFRNLFCLHSDVSSVLWLSPSLSYDPIGPGRVLHTIMR